MNYNSIYVDLGAKYLSIFCL